MTFQSRNAMSGLIHKDTHSASEPPSDPDQPVQMENPYHETPPRCPLCHFRVDYKNTQLLSQFVSPFTGRILSAEVTGLCKKKQKEVSKAIKRAQNADVHSINRQACHVHKRHSRKVQSPLTAFLPVIHKDPTFIHDPRILADKQTQ